MPEWGADFPVFSGCFFCHARGCEFKSRHSRHLFSTPLFFLKINLCAWPARLVRDSAARVKLLVDCLESFAGDVRVHFRGRDARVAEQFLYDAQVGAVFQQVCGETVS